MSIAWPTGIQLVFSFVTRFSVLLFGAKGSPSPGSLMYLEFSFWILVIITFVCTCSFIDKLEIQHEERITD